MAHALIITAKPGGGLSYEDNDVVEVLDGHQNPGSSVTPTDSGFCFVYVTDKEVGDPEIMALLDPWVSADDSSELLGKRRYQVVLSGSAFETWVPEADAATAGIEMTWAEIQAITIDKEA